MDPFSIVIGAAAGGVLARLLIRTRIEVPPRPPRPAPPLTIDATRVTIERAEDARPLSVLSGYAKFHMSLYVALAVAYLALMASEYARKVVGPNRWLVGAAVAGLLLAALAAATIATHAPRAASVMQLMGDRILPGTYRRFRSPVPTGRRWVGLEHLAFWCGIVAAVLSFNFPIDLRFAHDRFSHVSLDRAGDAGSAVLEWHVPGRGLEFHKLADLGSDQSLLVCVESPAGAELRVDRMDETRGPHVVVGGPHAFACRAVDGRSVFARSQDGSPARGKLLLR